MPPMIAPRTEVSLIESSTDKAVIYDMLHSHLFCFEHVIQRVPILFEPKFISSFKISIRKFDVRQGIILSSMRNNILIFFNWSCSFSEDPDEPVVPAVKAIMRHRSITNYLGIICFFKRLFR